MKCVCVEAFNGRASYYLISKQHRASTEMKVGVRVDLVLDLVKKQPSSSFLDKLWMAQT